MTETSDASRRPVILAFLIGGFSLVGLSIFSQTARDGDAVRVPDRVIRDQATSRLAPKIHFNTNAELQVTAMGWMAGSLHIHILVDSVSHMPGTRDLVRQSDDSFQWSMPAGASGTHDIGLYWADSRHRAIGDTVRARISID